MLPAGNGGTFLLRRQNSITEGLVMRINEMNEGEREFQPVCDLDDFGDHFLLTLEVPGVARSDLEIEIRDHDLVVTGERRRMETKQPESGWYSERRYGKFQRSFSLPPGIDAEKVVADYENGVLRIAVPKAEAMKPRKVEISTGTRATMKASGKERLHEAEKLAGQRKVNVA